MKAISESFLHFCRARSWFMFVFTQLAAAAAQNQVISLVTHSKHGSTQSSLNCPPPSLWSGLCKIFSLSSLRSFFLSIFILFIMLSTSKKKSWLQKSVNLELEPTFTRLAGQRAWASVGPRWQQADGRKILSGFNVLSSLQILSIEFPIRNEIGQQKYSECI